MSLSTAYEITPDDVVISLSGIKGISLNTAQSILSRLDHAAVERAALAGNDIDAQTEYAQDEIKRQIFEFSFMDGSDSSIEYEITIDDIRSSMSGFKTLSDNTARSLMNRLDHNAVMKVVSLGSGFKNQIEAARAEIKRQIFSL